MDKLAIIQARMSSTRLPGKVMLDLAGKPLLQRMLERVQLARSLDGLLVATTTDPSDDVLAQFCQRQGYPCFRGSLHDVLDRTYQAACQQRARVIIRLTADCPLIDPDLIDLTLAAFHGDSLLSSQLTAQGSPASKSGKSLSPGTFPFDFCADRLPPPWKRTLPIGLDVEVCSMDALKRAWREADQNYHREHVLPYLYEGVTFAEPLTISGTPWSIQPGTTPRGFTVALLNHTPDYGTLRWTVDTTADLEFVRQVYSRFSTQPHFTWQDILSLLENEPDLASINAGVKHKSAYDVDQRTLHR